MRIPSLHKQIFGDIDSQLNSLRAEMNKEIREKYFEALEKKRCGANG